ncbi:MAG: PEP-CTERM system TPR-repeat protein PrsT, partial [Gammaproteobacteria bacterium]|nr:PEP-CTERM system TPR-repeat protein PrsT [Gammaproteobacteria bacterium]
MLFFIAAFIGFGLNSCGSGTTVEEHISQAERFISQGDIKSSIIELKNALQKDPKHAKARRLLGKNHIISGNGAAAVKELTQARKLGLETPDLTLDLVRAMLLAVQFDEALDEIATATFDDQSGTLATLEGQAYLGLGQPEKAKAAFEQALEQNGNQLEARLGLATLAASAREFDAAQAQLTQILEIDGENTKAWLLRGELELIQRNLEEAEKAFNNALQYASGLIQLTARLGLARALLAQNHPEDAEKQILAVEAKLPNHPLAQYLKGVMAYQKKDIPAAQDALHKVLQAAPDHAPSMLLMGTINYAQGQLEQSANQLSRYLVLAPGHVPARKLLAAVHLSQKQPDRAITTLLPTVNSGTKDAQLLAMLGGAYMRLGDAAKAEEYLKQAADIAPDAAAIKTQLAVSHLASGATEQAISELESAVELESGVIQADILLILTHLRNKDFDQALAAASSMVERRPDDPIAFNLLGAAHLGKGDLDQARGQFEAALKINDAFIPAVMNLVQMDLKEKKRDAAKERLQSILKKLPNHAQVLVALAKLEGAEGKI